jgi:hypothetical protein
MPLEATQHTDRGAQAFAEFFVKTIDWGFATVSAAYLRRYANPTCSSCSTLAQNFDRYRHDHDRYVGGRITVRAASLSPEPLVRSAECTALITFDILSYELTSRSGHFISADGAHKGESFEVSLVWHENHWSVVDLRANA